MLCLQKGILSGAGVLPNSFNLAYNNFSGAVPTFLAESQVPTATKSGVSLLVSCAPAYPMAIDLCHMFWHCSDLELHTVMSVRHVLCSQLVHHRLVPIHTCMQRHITHAKLAAQSYTAPMQCRRFGPPSWCTASCIAARYRGSN